MSEGLCKNNRGTHGCQNVVTDGGEEDSGYCETCFWPGIVEANEKYAELLQQGHLRTDAAEISGLNDGERKHRYGTTMIDSQQQDDVRDEEGDPACVLDPEDEEEMQEDATNRILSRIEDENAAGDGLSGNPI